jgi:signal transduction histidine kinase
MAVLSWREGAGELAGLAHDLRTPLTVINGYAQLLKSDELSPEQRARACQLIAEKCEELNSLIRGFLEPRENELREAELREPVGARQSA